MKRLGTSDNNSTSVETPQKERNNALLALGATVFMFGMIWLYVREFHVFSNTISASRLVFGSIIVMALLDIVLIWRFRDRFIPWDKHVTELLFIGFFSLIFAPFFGSVLNRSFAPVDFQEFEFISEAPYVATGYGLLSDHKQKPNGYYLTVREKNRLYRFRYKQQQYFPITNPGEKIMLPVKTGWFGLRIVALE